MIKKLMIAYLSIISGLIFINPSVSAQSQQQTSCFYQKINEFTLDNNGGYLLVTIHINNIPVRMVVDTGSEGSLISPYGAQLLGLSIDTHQQTIMHGPRGGQNLTQNVMIPQMNLGNIRIKNLSIPIGNLPQYPRMNPPIVGLIGADTLSHYDVEFDIKHHKLSFWQIRANSIMCILPPTWGLHMHMIDIRMNGLRPFIEVQVNHYPLQALLDSGARSRIIALQKVLQMGISQNILDADAGGIASGIDMRETRYYWHQFKSFKLGQEIEYHPTLTVSPIHDIADMLIGSDWFTSHHIWISYQREKLFFIKYNNKQ